MYNSGEEFLNKLYSNMHMDYIVNHKSLKSDTPEEKINKYLKRLENVHEYAKKTPHRLESLLHIYYDKYIIKKLPEAYIALQKKMYKELGYDIDIDSQKKLELLEEVQINQKQSLREWIEYLISDDATYPTWYKNYVFQGILRLGSFDKEKMKFMRRTKTTVEPFLEINCEILAQIYDVLKSEIGENTLDLEKQDALNNGESFQKLYIYFLSKQKNTSNTKYQDGIWVKYDQGSDAKKLREDIQGKQTGWCSTGYATSKIQLDYGDYYVYYTKDEDGNYKNPRIAIRMIGKDKIGEIRGICTDQNLEESMIKVVEEKLKEFKHKKRFEKKVKDMKSLAEIEQKHEKNEILTKDELKILYEIDSQLDCFGYKKTTKIKELKSKRNVKEDLSVIFDCNVDQIGISMEDFDNHDIVVYASHLFIPDDTITSKFKNLKAVVGNLHAENIKTAKGLDNLKYIGGEAKFDLLEDAKALKNLKNVGKSIYCNNLEKSDGFNNLEYVGDTIWCEQLKEANNLKNLKYIGKFAYFSSLEDARGLENLEYIGIDANFESLENSSGLKGLQYIGGDANFNLVKDASSLTNLRYIGWDANFNSLKSASGLNNLEYIGKMARFSLLEDATGLENCNRYNRIKADINSLKVR